MGRSAKPTEAKKSLSLPLLWLCVKPKANKPSSVSKPSKHSLQLYPCDVHCHAAVKAYLLAAMPLPRSVCVVNTEVIEKRRNK